MYESEQACENLGTPRDFESPFKFKVKDSAGNMFKFTSSAENFEKLVKIVCERLKCLKDDLEALKYTDGDGDECTIDDDRSLR